MRPRVRTAALTGYSGARPFAGARSRRAPGLRGARDRGPRRPGSVGPRDPGGSTPRTVGRGVRPPRLRSSHGGVPSARNPRSAQRHPPRRAGSALRDPASGPPRACLQRGPPPTAERDRRRASIEVWLEFGEPIPSTQSIDLVMGALVGVVRTLLGSDWEPLTTSFSRPAPPDLEPYRRLFGPGLQFDGTFTGLLFPARDLDAPVVIADSSLRPYTQALLRAVGPPQVSSATVQVADVVELLLPLGRCSLTEVSRYLGLRPRALQRALAIEGESFSSVVHAIRARQAERYLSLRRLLADRGVPAAGVRRPQRPLAVVPSALRHEPRPVARGRCAPAPRPVRRADPARAAGVPRRVTGARRADSARERLPQRLLDEDRDEVLHAGAGETRRPPRSPGHGPGPGRPRTRCGVVRPGTRRRRRPEARSLGDRSGGACRRPRSVVVTATSSLLMRSASERNGPGVASPRVRGTPREDGGSSLRIQTPRDEAEQHAEGVGGPVRAGARQHAAAAPPQLAEDETADRGEQDGATTATFPAPPTASDTPRLVPPTQRRDDVPEPEECRGRDQHLPRPAGAATASPTGPNGRPAPRAPPCRTG